MQTITMKDIIKKYKYYIINTNKKYLVGKTSELMGYDMEEPQDSYRLVEELNHNTALLRSDDIDYDRDKDVVVHDSEGTLGECLDWIERQEPREMTLKDLTRVCFTITKVYVDGKEISEVSSKELREMRDYIVTDIIPYAKTEVDGTDFSVRCRVCVYLIKED